MENNRKSWERPVQIIAFVLLIAFLLSSCAYPFSNTCPSNDRNYWKKNHFPKHKPAYYKWANEKPRTGNKTLF